MSGHGGMTGNSYGAEDTCLTCGKMIPIPQRAYGISPDALCSCCWHDRRPSRLSSSESKEPQAMTTPNPPIDSGSETPETDDLRLSAGNMTRSEDVIRAYFELAGSLERRLLEAKAQLKKFDPDPVVCGCREAICPHTPIAQLPRQELVNYYKQLLRDERKRAEAAERGREGK